MTDKPNKPSKTFPLYAHANGQWAKKIKGKTEFFGVWSNPDAAVKNYYRQRESLEAGRERIPDSSGITISDLINLFLEDKMASRDSNDIQDRTFKEYIAAGKFVVKHLDPLRAVDTLRPDDFTRLKVEISRTFGLVATGTRIKRIRSFFKWGYDTDLLTVPVKFGPGFRLPARAAIRRERHQKPSKDFTAEQIRSLVIAASPQMRAMILLGINCGFGNRDCGLLEHRHVDFDHGWVELPRHKTAVERRCKLWPETAEMLSICCRIRREPRSEEHRERFFITRHGNPWSHATAQNPVSEEFTKLTRKLKIWQPRVSFYSLRHTFETIGGGTKDQVAVDAIMGHADSSMGGVYREWIDDGRLEAVSAFVHDWLWN